MANFNRVYLMGNLTRDPQLSYTPNNTAVCKFGIATNRKWKDRDERLAKVRNAYNDDPEKLKKQIEMTVAKSAASSSRAASGSRTWWLPATAYG